MNMIFMRKHNIASISFHVNDNSVPGAELNVELYEAIGQIYLEESDPYVLTAADIIGGLLYLYLIQHLLLLELHIWQQLESEYNTTDTSLISSTTNPNICKVFTR